MVRIFSFGLAREQILGGSPAYHASVSSDATHCVCAGHWHSNVIAITKINVVHKRELFTIIQPHSFTNKRIEIKYHMRLARLVFHMNPHMLNWWVKFMYTFGALCIVTTHLMLNLDTTMPITSKSTCAFAVIINQICLKAVMSGHFICTSICSWSVHECIINVHAYSCATQEKEVWTLSYLKLGLPPGWAGSGRTG
jgi:hypothetical protein